MTGWSLGAGSGAGGVIGRSVGGGTGESVGGVPAGVLSPPSAADGG